jgi:hypothetical protein
MKFISGFFLFVSMLPAQQIRSASWATDQFVLRYLTMLEPARPKGQSVNIGGGGFNDSVTQHRILMDDNQKRFFGYDLQVGVLGGGRFQLSFKPLTTVMIRKTLDLDKWTEISLSSVPSSMQLNDGDTVALDLLINPGSGEKIVEYITVSAPPGPGSSARDLQMGDIQMSLANPQLHINGRSWEWNRGDAHGYASGAVLWVHVPDRGRFLISFQPHADLGFRPAGEVNGSQVKFVWNGETYELKGSERILPADGAWNIYVYQDRGYQPGYPPALYGASDKPESLIHR